ncbi:MAG: hypothetical protein H0T42_09335 [Deltaproteobacteria bacterium]|nr:hypothetical protein [Deltaproteobacteria bacterium]
MTWLHLIAIGAAGIGSMKAAMEAGDLERAAHQGVLAGPLVVDQALTSADRATRMAGIAAAPATDDRIELLEALAAAAAGPDRRTAIPAAHAGRAIAREIARDVTATDLPDDVAPEDVLRWRDAWGDIARDRTRWIDVRVIALDVAAALDASAHASTAGSTAAGSKTTTSGRLITGSIGIDLEVALGDPDPAFRRAVVSLAPVPLPAALRAPLASTVVVDTDPLVALGAAQALCADLVVDAAKPILAALGQPGLIRLRAIIGTEGASRGVVRDAARCLAADRDPASAAALRTIRTRLR